MMRDLTGWKTSIRAHALVGLVVLFILVGAIGGWASTAQLASALIAPGSLVVDSNPKKVQHPTGGVVGELKAHDGDVVKAGDVLVRLDDTVTKANAAIVAKNLNGLRARAARLEAEQRNAEWITFPPVLLEQIVDDEVKGIIASEVRLFRVRLASRLGQKSQLQERIVQLSEEVSGLIAQEAAKSLENELVGRELVGVRDLYRQQLVQISRLMVLERDAARLAGERAQIVASRAQVKGKISETQLQIIQIDKDLVSDVSKDLRETNDKIGEYIERKVTAEDQLRRIDIRAPQDGMISQSTIHTVGGVVTAGEAIMMIVPQEDSLSVEARIEPQDIDKLYIGQSAILRFSAFNQRTTPEALGEVSRISPDTAKDQRTGQNYYTVRVGISAVGIAKLGKVRLVPGMPVEAFVQTGNRTLLAYLSKPMSDQLMRAFREK